jgi:hypothetical protein
VKGGEQGQCQNLVERNVAVSSDDSEDDDTPGESSGSDAVGGASGGGIDSGTDPDSDVPPINLINEPSGGGGTTDLLTLLAVSVLLAWPRRWRTRGCVTAVDRGSFMRQRWLSSGRHQDAENGNGDPRGRVLLGHAGSDP